MTAGTIVQSLVSGLLMGLIYALVAVGLSLIFGLMDVVNFAHGEFLMAAMYATLGFTLALAIDPIVAAPLVAALLFAFGALVYVVVIRLAMRATTNVGMVQIFSTFGLAVLMRGLAQFFFTPDYRSIPHAWTSGRTVSVGGVYLPAPQLVGALVSAAAFLGVFLLIRRTDLGKALEATREDPEAVALVGINRNRVFMLGWGLGSALVGLAGAVMAMFFYIYPDVGVSFALLAYVSVALGGFGSVFGALAAGIIVGLAEAITAMIVPPSLKSVGIYAVYLAVVFFRPRGLFGSM
jgi:branched-chain amino acid transport system permease protein